MKKEWLENIAYGERKFNTPRNFPRIDESTKNKQELSIEEIKKLIAEAPDVCPITGLSKCEVYVIDNNVVYLPRPAYNAYTLPTYDKGEKAFYRTRYDMDDGNREEYEHLCDLAELENHSNLAEIKKQYDIE